jgi:hypothetical protein
MTIFTRRVEHAFDVSVQCPHDADTRKYGRSSERRDQDQGFHCRLPLRRHVLGLRQLGDMYAGILQRDKLATAT